MPGPTLQQCPAASTSFPVGENFSGNTLSNLGTFALSTIPPACRIEATGCPFSLNTASEPEFAFADLRCPISGSQLEARTSAERGGSTSTSRSRVPTGFPDLRRTPSAELLYLPPLLSLLPPATEENALRDVTNTRVGYTRSHLPSIDEASIALHHALHAFQPKTDDYAYEPYDEAFNFDEIKLPVHLEREWYIVAFRSTRAKDSPSRDLYEADRKAHEEAVTAGGLLAYWFGVPNSRGSNLATCIWMSRAHAVRAIAGPKHVEAMRLAEAMYANYDLERYVLRKAKGEVGVTIEPWRGGEINFGADYKI
ncbi:BZ3500_MvSof-1268-A1-R1_Chr9g10511 [Microbotryum saponariae]|uniref:BZ3500_MvSof-1268-A1-R1_Chr9g10511 protein n=1 Tax=Microbotryum saponariae TaxID=289078 RepID=A0A2X0KA60_9BASI|nr:BZ3501_MvSof-1269-A2-R1_Chr9g10260 [Microbotryum saponariae]SDA00219.1 BZ3500_MvSof-1268-A1-R1_Chr9g10511 [Microbotryum saponariae]